MHLKSKTLRRGIGESKFNKNGKNIKNENDILIFDTGGGKNPTITKRAWTIFETTNHHQEIRGYQDNSSGKICKIVKKKIENHVFALVFNDLRVWEYQNRIQHAILPRGNFLEVRGAPGSSFEAYLVIFSPKSGPGGAPMRN